MTKQQRKDVKARQEYCRERDEAFLSLDEAKIREFCKKHGVQVPDNDTAFLAGIHKAIVHLDAASNEQKYDSVLWLIEHGFSPNIQF